MDNPLQETKMRNVLCTAVGALLLSGCVGLAAPPKPATPWKPLCTPCYGKMLMTDTGFCSRCKKVTAYSAYKYCVLCAKELVVCQDCGE